MKVPFARTNVQAAQFKTVAIPSLKSRIQEPNNLIVVRFLVPIFALYYSRSQEKPTQRKEFTMSKKQAGTITAAGRGIAESRVGVEAVTRVGATRRSRALYMRCCTATSRTHPQRTW